MPDATMKSRAANIGIAASQFAVAAGVSSALTGSLKKGVVIALIEPTLNTVTAMYLRAKDKAEMEKRHQRLEK